MKEKIKAFVITKNNSKKFDHDLKNFHQFESLFYYDSNYKNKNIENLNTIVNLTVTSNMIC